MNSQSWINTTSLQKNSKSWITNIQIFLCQIKSNQIKPKFFCSLSFSTRPKWRESSEFELYNKTKPDGNFQSHLYMMAETWNCLPSTMSHICRILYPLRYSLLKIYLGIWIPHIYHPKLGQIHLSIDSKKYHTS